jgi:glycosyltransferase involved in cell wall biosynthesis
VISCLRRAGVEVEERHVSVWDNSRDHWRAGVGTLARVAAAEARLFAQAPRDVDALIVGYPGHLDLPAARRAARRKPVVFNPLVSLADTFVADRGRFRDGSLTARALETLDRRAFGAADVVVADTQAQADFFATLTTTPLEVCFVGAEERVFRPRWRMPTRFSVLFVGKLIPLHGVDVILEAAEPFRALFVGKLIPLHGVETILAAARTAPELPFRIVGSGQLEHLLARRPPNVEHLRWIDYERLPEQLAATGCALGIFGTTAKAQRVIPNKAFQALACAAPLITANTAAARELLRDGRDALLVPPGDPGALAAALRRLAANRELATSLSEQGRATYEAHASETVLGARWRAIIERLL